MPPTFAELVEPNGVKAQMAVYLPKNYDANRLHPLLVFSQRRRRRARG